MRSTVRRAERSIEERRLERGTRPGGRPVTKPGPQAGAELLGSEPLVPSRFHLLLISGSTRHGSTNTAALATAREVCPAGVTATLFDGLAELPAFDPDDDRDPLPDAVAELRRQIAEADAVLFCTPEYAGALPGSFKNLLDWTVGGGEIYEKPVAWLNVAAQGRGRNAEASLATVLGYVGAEILQAACRRLPVSRDVVGPDGLITDARLRSEISHTVEAIAERVRR